MDIDRTAYGPDHPIVAVRLNNMGGVLRGLGDPNGARKHFQRAMEIFTAQKGENHPDAITVRRNLESLGP